MANQVLTRQSGYSGGISDDPRAVRLYRKMYFASQYIITKHFDIFSKPDQLIPYRSFRVDAQNVAVGDMKTYYVKDFLYASNSTKLYGLGQNGAGQTKIVYKADATTGNWTLPVNSEGNGAVKNGCLVEYKNYIWGFQGTTQVWKWGLLDGTPSITNSAGTVGTVHNTVTGVTVAVGGTKYNVNDVLTITNGNNSATVIVNTVDASGAVLTITILQAGYNQSTGSALATTVVPSGGTGCTLNITTVADVSTTITSYANGVVAKDDNLYLPYNNIIVRVYPSGTVQDQALKLPTNLKITSICNFGNYLAIGCSPINIYNGVSKVFLWNLTSPDIQEVIDWGEGELRILETIEGRLVGVTDRYLNNASGAGKGSLIIQTYSSGGSPQVEKEIFTSKLNGVSIPQSKTVKNNRLFFVAKIMTNDAGTEYNEGIWSFGRKSASYPSILSLDYIDENVTTAGIQSFDSAGNYFFISYNGDGSIDKIDETANFNFTSILETQIFNWGTTNDDKQLKKVQISVRKLKTGESITLKYKVDDAVAWTTIGTYNTVGGLSHVFLREETGDKDFTSGSEFKFRLESNGGAEITGAEYTAEFYFTP